MGVWRLRLLNRLRSARAAGLIPAHAARGREDGGRTGDRCARAGRAFRRRRRTQADADRHSGAARCRQSRLQPAGAARESGRGPRERVAKTKKVALGSEFKSAFKQVLPQPKDSSDAFKQGMEREWRPLWDQWLKTKTMPDMKREGTYDAGANTFATAAEKDAMEVDKYGAQKVGFHHRYQAWSIETK
jgi:hypothetical protein